MSKPFILWVRRVSGGGKFAVSTKEYDPAYNPTKMIDYSSYEELVLEIERLKKEIQEAKTIGYEKGLEDNY